MDPVLDEVCRQCHVEGGEASRRFDDWSAVYDQRQPILTQVYDCLMPPEGSGVELTLEQREVVLEWLVCGAPEN